MAYSTNILKERIKILNLSGTEDGDFGRKAKAYTTAATLWAGVDWSRGTKAMREGALDAYDFIMIRCRYTPTFTKSSRVEWKGKVYKIDSFHADEQENTIQATAMELVNG